jgi:hypothetical protein
MMQDPQPKSGEREDAMDAKINAKGHLRLDNPSFLHHFAAAFATFAPSRSPEFLSPKQAHKKSRPGQGRLQVG